MTDRPYLPQIEDLIRQAGQIALESFGRIAVRQFKPGDEPVTEADVRIETLLKQELAARFPAHGFLGEEGGAQQADREFVWIIDPIDGTRYFQRGVPLYSVAVALRRGDNVVFGAVYQPETDQLYSAELGEPACLNGRPLHMQAPDSLTRAMVCVELPNVGHSESVRHAALRRFGTLVDRCGRVRVLGVSALDLCYCASGAFDAYVRLGAPTKVWDVAAGRFILERAGGRITDAADSAFIVGAAPPLHDVLCELLST